MPKINYPIYNLKKNIYIIIFPSPFSYYKIFSLLGNIESKKKNQLNN